MVIKSQGVINFSVLELGDETQGEQPSKTTKTDARMVARKSKPKLSGVNDIRDNGSSESKRAGNDRRGTGNVSVRAIDTKHGA